MIGRNGDSTRRRAPPPRASRRVGLVVSLQAQLDRENLAIVLCTQPDFRVLGTAATGGETLALCASTKPQVLVLGTLVPWPPGVSGIPAIRAISPGTNVLALAPHAQDRCGALNPFETWPLGGRCLVAN